MYNVGQSNGPAPRSDVNRPQQGNVAIVPGPNRGNLQTPQVAFVPNHIRPTGHAVDPHNPGPFNYPASRDGHGAPVTPAIVPGNQPRGENSLAQRGHGAPVTPAILPGNQSRGENSLAQRGHGGFTGPHKS